MEERSLRVLRADTTFFSKISTTISKLLVPTKVGINGMLISIKRNNVLKSYEAFKDSTDIPSTAIESWDVSQLKNGSVINTKYSIRYRSYKKR